MHSPRRTKQCTQVDSTKLPVGASGLSAWTRGRMNVRISTHTKQLFIGQCRPPPDTTLTRSPMAIHQAFSVRCNKRAAEGTQPLRFSPHTLANNTTKQHEQSLREGNWKGGRICLQPHASFSRLSAPCGRSRRCLRKWTCVSIGHWMRTSLGGHCWICTGSLAR